MSLWATGFACVLVLCGTVQSFAQPPKGPRTLEGLVNSDDAQTPAASKEADTSPKRPVGTVTRPKDGAQHPDLDKAWADYEAAVAKVTESIKAAIAKQFDAATAKGDLDAAEKWQVIGEKFEKAGELPTDKEAKTAVSAAVADYKKARDEVSKAYEAVVKSLTMEKKIAEAKAVRDENETLKIALADTVPSAKAGNAKEVAAKQRLVASFVGRFRNAPNGDLQDIREDGTYVVNNNSSHEWSGRWIIDERDPKGPCLVRTSNNGVVVRFYIHPENPKTLTHSHGMMHRLQ